MGLLALAAFALVGSSVSARPTADDLGRLDRLYARANAEQGCDNRDYRVGQARLKARYQKRLEQVEAWFERNYAAEDLAAAADDADGGAEPIIVGGCLVRDGQAVMPDTRAFGLLLGRIERSISAGKDGGR